MAAGMCDGNDERLLLLGDECDVVWKAGQVDAPIARRTQPPKQRMLNNRGAGTLDLGAKSDAAPVSQ